MAEAYTRETEPDWDAMDDDELAATLANLVALTNVAAYMLGGRNYWVLFEGKSRSQFPRRHDPQAVEVHVWKEVLS
jgi:hypothetical protein